MSFPRTAPRLLVPKRACVRARMDAAAVSSPMVMVNVQGGRCWDTRAAVRSDWRGYGCLCLGEESWIQVENVGCRRTLAFGRASPLSYAHAASTPSLPPPRSNHAGEQLRSGIGTSSKHASRLRNQHCNSFVTSSQRLRNSIATVSDQPQRLRNG